jgi:hypothetical protein
MKALTILILVLISSSCVTQKVCQRKFPISADTVRIVILKDSIVYRDTIITVKISGETVSDTIVIPCPPPPPVYIPDTARVETTLAKAVAWWDYPYIKLRLIQKDTTIEARLDSAIREAYYWKKEYMNITNVVTVKEIPTIYKLSLWICIGILFTVLLIIFITIVFRK